MSDPRWEHEDALRALAAQLAPDEEEVARAYAGKQPERAVSRRGPFLRIAAAAAVVLAVGAAIAALWARPDAMRSLGPSGGAWAVAADGVRVRSDGDGVFAWSDGQPEVRWERGRVEVEVEPDRGIRFAVRTDEATVRVVGTGFWVDRDRWGTRVAVGHGRVAVSCADGSEAVLGEGEATSCLRSAAAGLGWVSEHTDAPVAERLAVLQRAAAHPDAPLAVRGEIIGRRIELLASIGRDEDAIRVATDALGAGTPLSDAVSARIVRLIGPGDCARTAPFLAALAANGDPVALVAQADCTPDPIEARALLERARDASGDPAGVIAERLARLPP